MASFYNILFDICNGHSAKWMCIWLFYHTLFCEVTCETFKASLPTVSAIVNITYRDPASGEMKSREEEIGRFGQGSLKESEWGWVVHVRTTDNKTHSCTPPVNVPKQRWIALIERGSCKFQEKIYNAAIAQNASAVVIYNDKHEPDLLTMEHQVADVVAIFIKKDHGDLIASLVDSGTSVLMTILVGQTHPPPYSDSINKTSVLFVTISFIVLMIISLAWLVFYYIQRFRYAHAKERLSKRLMNAAKKAITKMPVRSLKSGDKETENDYDQCAVCIENYRPSDVVRILPCKHMFHKSCVDPWLIEQRSCPMCKLDILKAYGLQIHGSAESIANIDVEGLSTSVGPSEILPNFRSHMGDSPPVEIIRYQPPATVTTSTAAADSAATAASCNTQAECHCPTPPASSTATPPPPTDGASCRHVNDDAKANASSSPSSTDNISSVTVVTAAEVSNTAASQRDTARAAVTDNEKACCSKCRRECTHLHRPVATEAVATLPDDVEECGDEREALMAKVREREEKEKA